MTLSREPRAETAAKRLFVAGWVGFRGYELGQAEFLVRELGGAVGVLAVNDDGDFDLGGGDQLDVDSAFPQAIEEPGGHAGVRSHPDPDHAQFGDSAGGDQSRGLDLLYDWSQQLGRGVEVVLVNRKRDVGGAMLGDALHDHIDDDVAAGDDGKNPAGDPGFVAHVVHRDL